MKYTITALLLAVALFSQAQELKTKTQKIAEIEQAQYLELTFTNAGGGVRAVVSWGLEGNGVAWQAIIDDNGKPRKFPSTTKILNEFYNAGWEFVQEYKNTGVLSGTYFIFKRREEK